MENTDSLPKQAAVDGKSAFAGNPSSTQDEGTNHLGIDQMGESAGLDIHPEEPLATKEKLEARDQERFDLDSANPETETL
ncbi:hypothetical protein S7335_2017 [Synechococcus sp. PCC 7335]|uniref:DUF6335 family protein n=1 Tax=Synechococcus sp. (strain ATCC 29403 / PCC 7335) TaxID=91464 RepID=UPI00017EE045|nr:DUF6335 family protein [Synechococcus sp. PCC 7335]EDX84320.1 hypothetical protein S7335_2017 [Synechococcus sp. PCC 7335]